MAHPELPSCNNCKRFIYDIRTGEVETDERGQPRKRWRGCPLPCSTCPKIPPGVEPIPANAREIDDRAISIYNYNLLLKEDTTNLLPRDAITLQHSAAIASVERLLEKGEQSVMMSALYRAIVLARTTNGVRA